MKTTIQKIAMGTKPDPYNFEVIQREVIYGNTVVMARYPGCLTFEGRKLMLLRGVHTGEFTTLDPHFLDEDYAVIARFVPNEHGWALAKICAGLSRNLTTKSEEPAATGS